MKLEGSGGSQLLTAIKHLTKVSDTLELATVVSPFPDMKVKLDGSNLVLDNDFLIITEASSKAVVGDRLVVAPIQNGQVFILLDKVVSG